MATYFDLMIETLKRELFTLLDGKVKKSVFRQHKEKFQRINDNFGRVF
jgi:hypothetical protein